MDVLTVFPERRDGWKSLQETWWLDTAPPGFSGTLDVGMPLFPSDGNLDTAAAGGYDSEWEKFGRSLASKYPTAFVRPGWEMNIVNWQHRATPENADKWREAFRKAAAAIKRGGPQLRVQWTVNSGVGNSLADAKLVWPGAESVDVVGVDAYGWAKEDSIDGKGGVREWAQFARQQGKPISVPEWGVHQGDGGAGDNGKFVARMTQLLKEEADNVAFASYFDEPEGYISNSIARGQAPNAGAALKAGLDAAAVGGA